MNAITDHLLEEFKPMLAVVCYRGKHNYYLESHPFNDSGELMEGKPLAQDTLQGMIDCFYDENAGKVKMGGIIPENLLSYQLLNGGDYRLVWYRPEQQRTLFFAPQLHLPSGQAMTPPLVYEATKKTLKVYALDQNERPATDTKIFRAPFHNTSHKGNVCLGSAKVDKPVDQSFEAYIDYWEKMFWLSEFTHLSSGNPTKSNLNLIWKDLVENPNKSWLTLDQLLPSDEPKTLKALLK